ncbi:MAG: epoxide hydrolase family protein, partial [Pseudomonadales bacterium]
MTELIPFASDIPETDLTDLSTRLALTRLPEAETVEDWSQGIPLAYIKEILDYWRQDYDWRRAEARLNQFAQFKTELDGLGIHFIHVRSSAADALPLIMTHGWPGSVFEFLKVIDPLTNPAAHGGNAADSFHVVCPTLPGFGFSDKPASTGWGIEKIGAEWGNLM